MDEPMKAEFTLASGGTVEDLCEVFSSAHHKVLSDGRAVCKAIEKNMPVGARRPYRLLRALGFLLEFDYERCHKTLYAEYRVAAARAAVESAKPDTGNDYLAKIPANPDLQELCRRLRNAAPLKHGDATQITREMLEGTGRGEDAVQTLLRLARRNKRLWKPRE
jgi:hypothetical protein